MKNKALIVFLIILIPTLLMQPVSAQNGSELPKINKPEYHYTQVYYREVEGMEIFIECPMTESNLANQNITFRISIHHLGTGMEVVLIKNKVTYTLKQNMNLDSYYTFGIYIDNPIGTNCTLEFILKTNWGDFEILKLLYIVSLRDPSLEYSQEVVYWVDNTTQTVEEEFRLKEEEALVKITLSSLFFYIIFCLVVGFIVSFVGIYMGRHGARCTKIKPYAVKENGIIRSIFVTVFVLAFLVPGVLFYDPITVISEEATKAKYMGYEFVTPIPYQELVYLFLQCFIFIVMMLAWFIFYVYGWKTHPQKDPIVPMEIKDKVFDPTIDIDIITEEVSIAKDRNGVERVVKVEDLTILEAWKRYIFGIERTCPRLIRKAMPLRDELRARIDGLPCILLDARVKERLTKRVDTQLEDLNEKLDVLIKKEESDEKLSRLEKLKKSLIKTKIKASQRLVEVWYPAYAHVNKATVLFNIKSYDKAVDSERAMEQIAYDKMMEARQSDLERHSRILSNLMKDELQAVEEEIKDEQEVSTHREGFRDSLRDDHEYMSAPATD